MLELIAGIVLFFGIHSVAIVAPGWRDGMVRRLGPVPWKAIYALVALVGIVLLIHGYGSVRWSATILYVPPDWMRHLGTLLLLPVFPLLLATYLPGRIRTTLKHPMLVAVKLWAISHLLMNGRTVDVLLFGVFLAWAVVDRISLKRRPAGPARAPTLPATPVNDVVAVVGGLAIYVVFALWLHTWLIGVPAVG